MNKKNIMKLVKWLEAGTPTKHGVVGLDMSIFGAPIRKEANICGTVACLAGTANAFRIAEDGDIARFGELENIDAAARWLGVDGDIAQALFYPSGWDGKTGARNFANGAELDLEGGDWELISPDQTARVLRNRIATGEVDWNVTEVVA